MTEVLTTPATASNKYPLTELLFLLAFLAAIIAWSAINDHPLKWFVQSIWVLAGVPILLASFSRFRFSPVTYRFIFIHACILLVGAHYTYQLTPIGLWAQDLFDLQRNHFDRVGHFAQGFVPALIAREILLRRSPLLTGKWLFFIVLCICMAISVWYEFLEWIAAIFGPQEATPEATKIKYLAQQGDVWDTQWDMFMAMIGAITAQVFLGRSQNRQMQKYDLYTNSSDANT